MKRAKVSLSNAKLESIDNVDEISKLMPTLVQDAPVLAANLHRVAERTVRSRIPKSNQFKQKYMNRFEKWWDANKTLYQPKRLVNNVNYDRYRSFFGLRGGGGADSDEADGDDNQQSVVIPTSEPAKPAAKPNTKKSGNKKVDNVDSILLRN